MNILNYFQNACARWRAILSRFCHMERHLVPPPWPFSGGGGIGKGTQSPRSERDSNERRLRPSCPCTLASFCF